MLTGASAKPPLEGHSARCRRIQPGTLRKEESKSSIAIEIVRILTSCPDWQGRSSPPWQPKDSNDASDPGTRLPLYIRLHAFRPLKHLISMLAEGLRTPQLKRIYVSTSPSKEFDGVRGQIFDLILDCTPGPTEAYPLPVLLYSHRSPFYLTLDG